MRYPVLALLLAVGACSAQTGTSSPANQVYAAKARYAALLTVAVAYNALPRCAPAVPAPCSDMGAVATIRSANATALSALDTAEIVVRSNGPAAASAAQTAMQAVATFQAIVAQYKGK